MAPADRCAMGPDSSPFAPDPAPTEGGPTACRRSALLRRDALDSVDRRTMERTAQAVWQPEHLLATAAAVGSQRGLADTVAGLAGPLE